MSAETNKLRLLHLARLLYRKTDDAHGLTLDEAAEELANLGISCERKALYRDIDALVEFGLHIERRRGKHTTYHLVDREFGYSKLMLLADAVQSSRIVPKVAADDLMASIKQLASEYEEEGLDVLMHVQDRIRTHEGSSRVLGNIEALRPVLRSRERLRFRYEDRNCANKPVLRHGGAFYDVSPLTIIYSEGFYYMAAFDDADEQVRTFRIDRMTNLLATGEAAPKHPAIQAFDVSTYQKGMFSMYTGPLVPAVLRVREAAVNAVVDRFGDSAQFFDQGDGTARVHVQVMESPTFYGWLAQFGTDVVIESPESLARAYRTHLQQTLEGYEAASAYQADEKDESTSI